MRNDFSVKTKETLARRVSFRCSNPLCNRRTTGPAEEPDRSVSIGVAAHITAASIGGPRYSREISEEQRRSVNNGIWLCQNCAKLIDADPDRYPVQILKDWKTEAEACTLLQIEAPISEENTVLDEIRELRKDLHMSFYTLGVSRNLKPYPNDMPIAYLDNVLKISSLLEEDISLFDSKLKQPFIGLDFSEIYAYVSAKSDLLISLPIVDFCITNSTFQLCLPPGTVCELQFFVEKLRNDGEREIRNFNMKTLDDFVKLYEQGAESRETAEAYEKALKQIVRIGGLYWSGFDKLDRSLSDGKISPTSEAAAMSVRTLDQDRIRYYISLFRKYKPVHMMANAMDAVNLCILANAQAENPGKARMISSGSIFSKVAKNVFGGSNLVRRAKDYAVFLKLTKHVSSDLKSITFKELTRATLNLQGVLRDIDFNDVKAIMQYEKPFKAFADHYKNILFPVDEMIRNSVLALPDKHEGCIREFYEAIVAHYQLAAGFRFWWESICKKLHSIGNTLEEKYLATEIRKTIDKKIE